MIKMNLKLNSILVLLILATACNKGPKDKSTEEGNDDGYSKLVKEDIPVNPSESTATINNSIHKVVVKEILPASRYEYLFVQENDKQFWIAIRKQKVNIGETYYYKGGLLKTNFKSNEHNKTFDKIYLVTSLVQSNHGDKAGQKMMTKTEPEKSNKPAQTNTYITGTEHIHKAEESISISELVKNQKKYKDKIVQITGKCVKINPNIMGRNWIHLKDGSMDNYDLVITSDHFVKEGSVVTINAKVILNKDFGAGYSYKLILENGIIIP